MDIRDNTATGGSGRATAPLGAILSALPAILPGAAFAAQVPSRRIGAPATPAQPGCRLPGRPAADGRTAGPGHRIGDVLSEPSGTEGGREGAG